MKKKLAETKTPMTTCNKREGSPWVSERRGYGKAKGAKKTSVKMGEKR